MTEHEFAGGGFHDEARADNRAGVDRPAQPPAPAPAPTPPRAQPVGVVEHFAAGTSQVPDTHAGARGPVPTEDVEASAVDAYLKHHRLIP